jgi:hypothetical protein
MEQPWKYIGNQFDSETETSYKKAVKLSHFHDARLLSAQTTYPLLAPLYTRYHPLHLALMNGYSAWRTAGGTQEEETLTVRQLMDQAMLDLDGWDVQVQVVYPKTTARYRGIFPNGRKPFRQGGLELRIDAFQDLSNAIGTDVALAAVKTAVDSTHSALVAARTAQEGAKGGKLVNSGAVEAARLAAMNMQYRNMGVVIDAYFDDREMLCNAIFDLETLRNPEQQTFTMSLDVAERHDVATRTLLADDELRAKLTGPGRVHIFLASTPGGVDSTPVVVNTDADLRFAAAAFGITDYTTHRHITVVNESGATTRLSLTV